MISAETRLSNLCAGMVVALIGFGAGIIFVILLWLLLTWDEKRH